MNDVDKILGTSTPPAKPVGSALLLAAAGGCGHPARGGPRLNAKPTRERRPMTAEEKNAVSERMTAYWAERRKKAAK